MSIKFPSWVDNPARQSKAAKASKRLNYLLYRAALQVVPSGNITAFAKFIGVERSTLHTFVQDGSFSPRMAIAIEEAVGRDHTPHEYLRNPLEIATE
jgi:hypothetical protein